MCLLHVCAGNRIQLTFLTTLMKNNALLLLLVMVTTSVGAQSVPQRQWHRFYGGSQPERFTNAFTPTMDGGCIFSANTYSNDGLLAGRQNPKRTQQLQDDWIVKLDAKGDTLWTLTLPANDKFFSANRINAIREMPDHGFMLAGNGLTSPGTFVERRARLVKVSATGNIEWDKGYLSDRDDLSLNLNLAFWDGIPTADGGFLAVGHCLSELLTAPPRQTNDIWAVKVSSTGVKQWEQIYKIADSQRQPSLVQLAEDELIIMSLSDPATPAPQPSATMLLKTNMRGELAAGWPFLMNRLPNRQLSNPVMALSVPDKSVVVLERYGDDATGKTITRVRKIDVAQAVVWEKELDTGNNSVEVASLASMPDGRLIIGHFTKTNTDICTIRSLQIWDKEGAFLANVPITKNGAEQIQIGPDGSLFLLNQSVSDPTCFPDLTSNAKTDLYVAKYCAPALITVQGSTSICAGSTLTLAANNSAGASFQWLKNGLAVAGATGQTFAASEAGVYTVQVNSFNCSSTSAGVTLTTRPRPDAVVSAPTNTDVCAGVVIQLRANTGTGLTYRWTRDGVPIADATDGTFTPTQSGKYAVLVSLNGCEQESKPVPVQINPLPVAVATSNSPVAWLHTIRLMAAPDSMSYRWEGPGGYVSTRQNPRRCWATKSKLGDYTLTVTNPTTTCAQSVVTTVKK